MPTLKVPPVTVALWMPLLKLHCLNWFEKSDGRNPPKFCVG